jgi:putative flippase GtrA
VANASRFACCAQCGSGSLLDAPSGALLSAWYRESYYGQGQRKFHAPLQRLFEGGKAWIALARASRDRQTRLARARSISAAGNGALLAAFEARGVIATGLSAQVASNAPCAVGCASSRATWSEQRFAPASFEIVTLLHVLEHFEDPAATLEVRARAACAGRRARDRGAERAPAGRRACSAATGSTSTCRGICTTSRTMRLCLVWRARGFRIARAGTFEWLQGMFGFVQSLLNRLFPRPGSNRLFALMREARGAGEWLELGGWILLAALLATTGYRSENRSCRTGRPRRIPASSWRSSHEPGSRVAQRAASAPRRGDAASRAARERRVPAAHRSLPGGRPSPDWRSTSWYFAGLIYGAGIHYLWASVGSFLLATLANYVVSVRLVFASGARFPRLLELVMIYAVSATGLVWTQMILFVCVERAGLHVVVAKLVAIGCVFFWNYLLRNHFVFASPRR